MQSRRRLSPYTQIFLSKKQNDEKVKEIGKVE
jgi:hypothetical protein